MTDKNYRSEVSTDYMAMIRKAWPELNILWSCNVGDYQGTIYVIGYTEGKVLACGLGYGSCSGCGAWAEPDKWNDFKGGGEPHEKKDFIDSGVFGKSLDETLKWADEQSVDCYQHLRKSDQAEMKSEIRRAFGLIPHTPKSGKGE